MFIIFIIHQIKLRTCVQGGGGGGQDHCVCVAYRGGGTHTFKVLWTSGLAFSLRTSTVQNVIQSTSVGRSSKSSLNAQMTSIWRWIIRSVTVIRMCKHIIQIDCSIAGQPTTWPAYHVLSRLLPYVWQNTILQAIHLSENGISMSKFLSYPFQFLCPCKMTNLKQIFI